MSPSTLLAHPINQWHIAFPIWKTIHQARMWLNSAKIHNYYGVAAAAAKSLQSCPTVCDPTDCSPPGSPVPGFLQARTLEWVAISFSNAWKWTIKLKSPSRVWLLATPWTAAHQAPPSMGFPRQEYWSGVPWLVSGKEVRKILGRHLQSPASSGFCLTDDATVWRI